MTHARDIHARRQGASEAKPAADRSDLRQHRDVGPRLALVPNGAPVTVEAYDQDWLAESTNRLRYGVFTHPWPKVSPRPLLTELTASSVIRALREDRCPQSGWLTNDGRRVLSGSVLSLYDRADPNGGLWINVEAGTAHARINGVLQGRAFGFFDRQRLRSAVDAWDRRRAGK